MSSPRILLLADPAPPVSSDVRPETMMLGLPIMRRSVLAAGKAGWDRVLVAARAESATLAQVLAETGAEFVSSTPALTPGVVALPWNQVVDTRALRELRSGTPLSEVGIPVRKIEDLAVAEKWLLSRLIKETDGFMARHLDRKISLAISRWLARTSITPNAMTLVSVGIGVAGAPFFLSQRPALQTIGALLFVLHSVVDGCDGELARLKLQESRLGGILDFWGDNVVHVAIFAAVAVGWSLSVGAAWPLLLGVSAVAGTLASAGFAYFRTMQTPKEGPLFTQVTASTGPGARLANALARRDFIYLVLALSLVGKAHWFLVLAAVGAPAFFVAIVLLGRRPEKELT